MNKHTPGPWRIVDREALEDGSVYPRHVVGGDDNRQIVLLESMTVAELAHASPNGIWDFTGVAQANARLIAAAPDLLRALKRLLKSVPAAADCEGGTNVVEYTDREWDELCAATSSAFDACAKAEGKA